MYHFIFIISIKRFISTGNCFKSLNDPLGILKVMQILKKYCVFFTFLYFIYKWASFDNSECLYFALLMRPLALFLFIIGIAFSKKDLLALMDNWWKIILISYFYIGCDLSNISSWSLSCLILFKLLLSVSSLMGISTFCIYF